MIHPQRNIVFYILLSVLIWTGCSDILAPPNPGVKGLKITISGDAVGSRTLYPETGFTKYVLSFEGPSDHENVTIQGGAVSVLVEDLVVGDWTITATGYVRASGTERAAAVGSAEVTIVSGAIQDINIPISAQQEPGVNGFFSYTITYPGTRVNSGNIELRPFNNNELGGDYYSLNGSPATGTFSLAPGFYVMTIKLYDGYRDVIRAEIVHIYSNMETKAEYTFTNGDFNEIFTLSGTLGVTVNGAPLVSLSDSASANIYAQLNQYGNQIGSGWINLNDNTWSMTLPAFDADVTLSFSTYASIAGSSFYQNIDTTVTVKNQDKSVNLGAIDIKAIYLRGTINVTYDGQPMSRVEINSQQGSGSTTLTSPGANAPWSILVQAFDEPMENISFGVRGYQSVHYDDYYGYSIEEPIFNKRVETDKTASEEDIEGITIDLENFLKVFDPANPPVNPNPLTENVWVDNGVITESYDVDWYSIGVIEGTTYNLWWNRYWYGNANKTLDGDVYAWYSNGTPIYVANHYSAWSNPVSFTARSTGTVYIRVRGSDAGESTGTYGIVYSTGDTRPGIGEFTGGLAQKLQWIINNAEDGDKYDLDVTEDESIDPQYLSHGYYNDSNRTVTITIKGDEPGRKISLNSNGSMFTVRTGVKLILENITLEGLDNNTEALVTVYGDLEINDGVTITGHAARHGGVHVEGGTFTMNGGEISGNTAYDGYLGGGGVFVNSGTFTMNGGAISGNIAEYYGGGVSVGGGTFTMNGGSISGNTAVYGGGLFIHDGTITMNGGSISDNTAIHGGGGVYVTNRTFTMKGGDISSNTASSGGGVDLNGGGFAMSGGAIFGNTASSGGGVHASSGTINKTGGTIYGYIENDSDSNTVRDGDNTVQDNRGHAVFAYIGSESGDTVGKRKETAAGPTVNLWYNYNNGSPTWNGGWDDE